MSVTEATFHLSMGPYLKATSRLRFRASSSSFVYLFGHF